MRTPEAPAIHMTQQMTTKAAPCYAGRTSFFAFGNAIDDWRDVTELEAEKRGPALKNRLEREAAVYTVIAKRAAVSFPLRFEPLYGIIST